VISGGAGGDTLDGGGGINTISYSSSADRVRVDLLNGIASGGDAAGDTLYHFQNINGSLNADKLTGDNGDNVIYGVLGNDVMVGYGGNDTFLLIGGASLAGGPGLAVINGGAGNDVFQLFSLAPATYGDAFTAGTRVIGGSGYDTLELRNTSPVTFVSTTISGVERIVVEDGFNYTLATHNTNVAAGAIPGSRRQRPDWQQISPLRRLGRDRRHVRDVRRRRQRRAGGRSRSGSPQRRQRHG
jgi:Ca2+-binding RTX toxin-like protein